MEKATLVLEGGATRGVFTSGALDFLMEQKLYMSHVIGVSAGACNGVDYVSKQIGRTKNCMIHTEKEYDYINLRKFVRERSLIDMDMIFEKFPNEVYPFDFDTYFQSDIVCEMVTTNCVTGKAEYMTEKSDPKRLMKVCRASSSLPLFSPIVNIDGTPYLDGGLADSVPIERALEIGNEKIVVILTRNPGYQKKMPSKGVMKIYRSSYKTYPNLLRTIARRSIVYNRTMEKIEKLEEEGKIFVLRPQMKTVSRLERNADTLTDFYNHGYNYMKKQYHNLLEYLQKEE